jgi:predicted DsbA family dithiol-disulfide isomerase
MKIQVAHDFICPWCWIGLFQAKRLEKEFGIEIEWLSYELFPDELEWVVSAGSAPPPTEDQRKPKTPTRMDLAYAAEGMEPPTATRPFHMRTHFAHEAVEYAKTEGVANEFVEKLYRAYWEEGQNINEPEVLAKLAEGTIKNISALNSAISEKRFKDKIVGFDDPAYDSGVFNVPTFYIGGERYAEQPYVALRKATEAQRATSR